MEWLKKWFVPVDTFSDDEWIRKEQSTAMLTFAFFFGLGVLPFAWHRWTEENHIVAISQMILGVFLIVGAWRLRRDKRVYDTFSLYFFLFFLLYTFIIFFYVPSNRLNILWVVAVPVFIFFFLDRRAGNLIFGFVGVFVAYLIATDYPYSIAEYVTLIAALLSTTFVMYVYENVKEAERKRMQNYTRSLQKEIDAQTMEIRRWNEELERRVEEEVARRMEQEQMLLHQNRLANMGEMIDAIAHQWRQPLMSINALLLNLDRGVELGKERSFLSEKINAIGELTEHMSQTISDFRMLLQPQKDRRTFEVGERIEQVLGLMDERLRGIEIVRAGRGEIRLFGYPNEMSQWLMIVLTNAAETIRLRAVASPRITITSEVKGDRFHLRVEDNAGGIDPAILSQVCEPYFTTKNQGGGTGLGLYIARLIVERNMGGELHVTNQNGGAAFALIVPA